MRGEAPPASSRRGRCRRGRGCCRSRRREARCRHRPGSLATGGEAPRGRTTRRSRRHPGRRTSRVASAAVQSCHPGRDAPFSAPPRADEAAAVSPGEPSCARKRRHRRCRRRRATRRWRHRCQPRAAGEAVAPLRAPAPRIGKLPFPEPPRVGKPHFRCRRARREAATFAAAPCREAATFAAAADREAAPSDGLRQAVQRRTGNAHALVTEGGHARRTVNGRARHRYGRSRTIHRPRSHRRAPGAGTPLGSPDGD